MSWLPRLADHEGYISDSNYRYLKDIEETLWDANLLNPQAQIILSTHRARQAHSLTGYMVNNELGGNQTKINIAKAYLKANGIQ